jgi:Zn finger protein HypA/HybF involved in hydrogenase expression
MQNRFAEMECLVCGIYFKIKLESEEYIPDMKFLFCPICGSNECKALWIDHDKTNYNGNKNNKNIK